MAIIEKRLHEHFANLDDDAAEATPPNIETLVPRDAVPEAIDPPFAKVNTVVDNSPAATAGLKPGDLIRNFGYVNLENHDSLKKVAECVQGNEGVRNCAACEASTRLTSITAKHLGQGLTKQWGRLDAAGTSVDANATARLGRPRHAWMPHPTAVK
jgi:26S proteasome non-ATPase regulatory subunit 9